jgi:hypothetical protein
MTYSDVFIMFAIYILIWSLYTHSTVPSGKLIMIISVSIKITLWLDTYILIDYSIRLKHVPWLSVLFKQLISAVLLVQCEVLWSIESNSMTYSDVFIMFAIYILIWSLYTHSTVPSGKLIMISYDINVDYVSLIELKILSVRSSWVHLDFNGNDHIKIYIANMMNTSEYVMDVFVFYHLMRAVVILFIDVDPIVDYHRFKLLSFHKF